MSGSNGVLSLSHRVKEIGGAILVASAILGTIGGFAWAYLEAPVHRRLETLEASKVQDDARYAEIRQQLAAIQQQETDAALKREADMQNLVWFITTPPNTPEFTRRARRILQGR